LTPEEPTVERYVRVRSAPPGMVRIEMQLLPDEAERVLAAIERSKEQLRPAASGGNQAAEPRGEISAETRSSAAPPSRADGVVHLAEKFLARSLAPGLTGSGGQVCGGDVTELCVVVERDGLTNDGEWQARVQGGAVQGSAVPGGAVPGAATLLGDSLLRLACDAGVVPMVVGEQGEVLDVGRKTRTIPPAIRRALRRRDGGCRFPGCSQIRWLDAHHIKHWAHGGETKLANLVNLCSRHHKAVHEYGFQVVVAPGGAIEFSTPEGAPRCPPPSSRAAHRSTQVDPAPRWIAAGSSCGCSWIDGRASPSRSSAHNREMTFTSIGPPHFSGGGQVGVSDSRRLGRHPSAEGALEFEGHGDGAVIGTAAADDLHPERQAGFVQAERHLGGG
jgi:hypothetical protein